MVDRLSEKHSSNIRDVIYGEGVPKFGDPAENYHIASKLTRAAIAWETPMIPVLMESKSLQLMSTRASKRYESRESIALPEPRPLENSLQSALYNRRSNQGFIPYQMPLEELSDILIHAYGSYRYFDQYRRNTPSGGALYPLDIYVISRNVLGLPSSLSHFDPFEKNLRFLDYNVDLNGLGNALLLPDAVENASAFLVISASFWRTRFKYSQRSHRFCCIEAGHLMQNFLTIATSIGIETRMFGGFIDNEIESMIPGHNGVDEGILYVLAIGK